MTLFGNFDDEEDYKLKLPSLESSKEYFDLLLGGMTEELKEKLKK
ncbi:hypothetical protein ACFSC6_13630 [Rufibacter sediminis]|nr:hypothetical protein [Rufibacter sediminis]